MHALCMYCWLRQSQTEGSSSVEDVILKLQASGKSVPEVKKKELIADLQVSLIYMLSFYIT